ERRATMRPPACCATWELLSPFKKTRTHGSFAAAGCATLRTNVVSARRAPWRCARRGGDRAGPAQARSKGRDRLAPLARSQLAQRRRARARRPLDLDQCALSRAG